MRETIIFGIIGILVLVIFCSGCLGDKESDKVDIVNEVYPIVVEFNKSKGPDTAIIPIKGDIVVLLGLDLPISSSDSYYLSKNENSTIFSVVNQEDEFVGTYYGSEGNLYNGYRYVTDVVVIYWPEKKVVGWHRIYGEGPVIGQHVDPGFGEDNLGKSKPHGDDLVEEWIESLPGYKESMGIISVLPRYKRG